MAVTVEAVLRAQGAGPSAGRHGRPVTIAKEALRRGLPVLRPARLTRQVRIERVAHSSVHLSDGGVLSGSLIAGQLASAREVAVVLATVGPEIADLIGEAAGQSPSLALALEGVATATLEASVAGVLQELERTAAREGWRAGPALNPGMEGWPLEVGQRELFALLGGCASPVRLMDSGMMWPRHSLSLAVGLGPDLSRDAVTCDWCGARTRCRHRPLP